MLNRTLKCLNYNFLDYSNEYKTSLQYVSNNTYYGCSDLIFEMQKESLLSKLAPSKVPHLNSRNVCVLI